MSTRPAPPKPTPKPGRVKVYRALYKYTAQQSDELSFEEGDTLYVLDMTSADGWWQAKCGNKIGIIPSNYVEVNMESVDFPLHDAARRGNLDFLQECLNNQVSVNGLDKAGSTPLSWAAHGGHLECVQKLLAVVNIELNSINKLGDTPLHSAAWKGHAAIVKLLLEMGASPYIKNLEGKTPYDLAKDPETAILLKYDEFCVEDYGDAEDSD